MNEDDIYPLLAPLAGGKVYPYVAPLDQDGQPSISPPWVVFSIISAPESDTLCGQAETTLSVQVDVYSRTISEAREIRSQAFEAIQVLKPESVNNIPGYEPEARLYRASLEFQVLY